MNLQEEIEAKLASHNWGSYAYMHVFLNRILKQTITYRICADCYSSNKLNRIDFCKGRLKT